MKCACVRQRERTGCSDLLRISCSYLFVLNSHDYLFIDEGNYATCNTNTFKNLLFGFGAPGWLGG